MTKIKICGLSRPEDIQYANQLQPDYVGFVFAKSKRQISESQAKALRAALQSHIPAVGVFVNAPIQEVIALLDKNIIQIAQLHGDEDAPYIEALQAARPQAPIIKAVPVAHRLTIPPLPADYFLFDTYDPNARGGTGTPFRHNLLQNYAKPYFLAGGLNTQNLAAAIETLHPFCVDVSSGAETDGKKDFEKMQALIKIANST